MNNAGFMFQDGSDNAPLRMCFFFFYFVLYFIRVWFIFVQVPAFIASDGKTLVESNAIAYFGLYIVDCNYSILNCRTYSIWMFILFSGQSTASWHWCCRAGPNYSVVRFLWRNYHAFIVSISFSFDWHHAI